MCLKVCCYSNSFSVRKNQHIAGQGYENSRNYKAITALLTHYCIVMILFPNYSSPQLANFQDWILQQGFHKLLRHKRHLQYEEDILKKIFLKRESRQTCKVSSVRDLPDPSSSLFQCDPPWGAEHDRAEWRRLARPGLKRNAVSLACKAAEQECWES